jgi:hypothetical protein
MPCALAVTTDGSRGANRGCGNAKTRCRKTLELGIIKANLVLRRLAGSPRRLTASDAIAVHSRARILPIGTGTASLAAQNKDDASATQMGRALLRK